MMVGCNFEQFEGFCSLRDFIQHDALSDQTVEKALWIKHHAANPREFTGRNIQSFGEIPTKAGFPNPPHSSEPDDGSLLPRTFEPVSARISCVPYETIFAHSSTKCK